MENKCKLYVLNQNIKGFQVGEIVKSFVTQPYKHQRVVTNYKVIGKWSCCGCNRYKEEAIENKYLDYLDEY